MLEILHTRTAQYVYWLEHHAVTRADGVDRTDLPHRLMEDDVYNGYFLAKGSWVIGNIWLVPGPVG